MTPNETHISPIANDLFGIETIIGLKPYEHGTFNNDLEAMAGFLKQMESSGYHIGEVMHDTLAGFQVKFQEIFTLDEMFESLKLSDHDFLKEPEVPGKLGIRDEEYEYTVYQIGGEWVRYSGDLEKKEYFKWKFTNAAKSFASTISSQLVSVQPMSAPSGQLFYLDYIYGSSEDSK